MEEEKENDQQIDEPSFEDLLPDDAEKNELFELVKLEKEIELKKTNEEKK